MSDRDVELTGMIVMAQGARHERVPAERTLACAPNDRHYRVWRLRQSLGVSPVNLRNAAANAVCEE